MVRIGFQHGYGLESGLGAARIEIQNMSVFV